MKREKYLTLLREENIISLRSAFIFDDGYLVVARLSYPSMEPHISGLAGHGRTILFRHKRSIVHRLMGSRLGTIAEEALNAAVMTQSSIREKKRACQNVKAGLTKLHESVKEMKFSKFPDLDFLWSDSGKSVAVLLLGEPWAFIVDEKPLGYSKGVFGPGLCNPWDERLFQTTFLR